jgi:hypothetical protein
VLGGFSTTVTPGLVGCVLCWFAGVVGCALGAVVWFPGCVVSLRGGSLPCDHDGWVLWVAGGCVL